MNCAVEILRKHKTVLEVNIKGVEGMIINEKLVATYRKQVRDLKKAIEYLEFVELRKSRKSTVLSGNEY